MKNTSSNGIGFVGLLTILFIGLKLAGHIKWSWWWVVSPSLICLGTCVLIFIIAFTIAVVRERRKIAAARKLIQDAADRAVKAAKEAHSDHL